MIIAKAALANCAFSLANDAKLRFLPDNPDLNCDSLILDTRSGIKQRHQQRGILI
jgi:hypothetical protein